MIEQLTGGVWRVESGRPGPSLALSFGVHGNERPPVDGGLALVEQFKEQALELSAGRLLLLHSNPRASAADTRWSEGGVDLNRCFHPDTLAREPQLWEEGRARELAAALDAAGIEVLVDFHCTVEPGPRFMIQHPEPEHAPSRQAWELLAAEILLTDPGLSFGGVSLDEHMTTRGLVGICYETGWLGDPALSGESVLAEMQNVLAGHGMLGDRTAARHREKTLLRLTGSLLCEGPGFQWREGVGENLQALPAGCVLGAYGDGRELSLERDASLVFPKKKPELVEMGKPLVLLAGAPETGAG